MCMSSTTQVMAMGIGEGFAWGLHPGSLWCSAGVLFVSWGCWWWLSCSPFYAVCAVCPDISGCATRCCFWPCGHSLVCVSVSCRGCHCQALCCLKYSQVWSAQVSAAAACFGQWPAAVPSHPCYMCCPNSHMLRPRVDALLVRVLCIPHTPAVGLFRHTHCLLGIM